MRIAYYTHPAFFEPALCLVRELSRRAEVHLLLELSPGAWRTAGFDLGERDLPRGVIPADPVLRDAFPAGVRDYWQSAASFHLVVHRTRRSLHPFSWTTSRQALRHAARTGAELLHVDDVDVSPRLPLALKWWRRPLVITVHDPEPHSGERNWRKTLGRRLAFPHAARFVVYNGAYRDAFAARYRIPPAAVTVTRMGAYEVFRAWAPPPVDAPPTVLFFGRLSVYKGLDLFYQAARLIASRTRGVRFVVAGRPVAGYTPPDPPPLEGGCTIDVVDRYLVNADAAALLGSATVVVCPYRDATQSGVVLTAFALGVPVVATAVGGLPEYVMPERTGLLVPVGDAAALADAVGRVLHDRAFAAALRRGIAEAAQNELSWRVTAAALATTYAAAREGAASAVRA